MTGTLEAHLQRSLLARTVLLEAGASVGGGVALAETSTAAGVGFVVLALAGLAYWWRVQYA